MADLLERVHVQARTIRPLRAFLTVCAFPFYVLGVVAGIAIVVVLYGFAAVKTGVADVKAKAPSMRRPVGDS